MATTKNTKVLIVVAVYKFKTNGKLNGTKCTLVRNSEGVEYKIWTHASGCKSSCDCEGYQRWHRVCYHVRFVEAREAAKKPATAVNTPIVVATPDVKKEVKPVQTKMAASKTASDRRLNAPLNGNSGFSLLKKPAA